MSTTAVTPEVNAATVTINNTPEEIAAAPVVETPQASPQPQEVSQPAPVETKPYTIATNQDGSVTVQFMGEKGPKETFTGAMEEVLDKVANKAVNITRVQQPIQQEPIQQNVQTPTQPEVWKPTTEQTQQAIEGFIAGDFQGAMKLGLAQLFNMPPEQVLGVLNDLPAVSMELRSQKEINSFAQLAPDFPWSQDNVNRVITELNNAGIPVNAKTMAFAHNALKGQGVYKPATQATRNSPPPPPPTHSATAPQTPVEDPWTMPMDKLEGSLRKGF
jgi:hypothetical protein